MWEEQTLATVRTEARVWHGWPYHTRSPDIRGNDIFTALNMIYSAWGPNFISNRPLGHDLSKICQERWQHVLITIVKIYQLRIKVTLLFTTTYIGIPLNYFLHLSGVTQFHEVDCGIGLYDSFITLLYLIVYEHQHRTYLYYLLTCSFLTHSCRKQPKPPWLSWKQGLSQDLETGCLKLAIVKILGIQNFKGDHYILIFQP